MSNYTDSLEFENDILKEKNKQLREALINISKNAYTATDRNTAIQALRKTNERYR